MIVLQINAVYGSKSTGVVVKGINDMLIANGHDAYVAYQESASVVKNGHRIGNLGDWKFHALYTRAAGKQAYASKNATRELLKYIDHIKPDIIHLHNLHGNYINLCLLTKYIADKKIATVLTLHDCWFFTGKCFHFVEAACEKWKFGCSKCPRNKNDIPSVFFDCSQKVYNDKKKWFGNIEKLQVVGVSNWMSDNAHQSFFSDRNISTILNGVDTSIFNDKKISDFPKTYGLEGRRIILGMANKWLLPENKQAMSQIIENLDKDEMAVIIGCTTNQIKALPKMCLGLKYINNPELLADVYRAASVFVNLTWADSLPTVNMESICCGTPVVTYNSCGSAELISEKTGLVITHGDINGLIEGIRSIKGYSREECVIKGQERFDKNVNYLKYLDLYNETLNKLS